MSTRLYPFTFHPLLKERIWGGRNLEKLYGKALPSGAPFGESWEMSDRPGDVSVIANGPLAGNSLRWLMENHSAELLGNVPAPGNRFPWLIKILDAREKLSLQVHPPAQKAPLLGGEPKTEMWYIAQASPSSQLFVGLKRGVTREEFENKIKDGTVADCFHRINVKKGDCMFLPSGRVHALGEGNVIFEIQQNSDTTYRVFDWNRLDAAGKPRDLHVDASLASIDFNDFEPGLVSPVIRKAGDARVELLVADPLFTVEKCSLPAGESKPVNPGAARVIAVLEGRLVVRYLTESIVLQAGQFCLFPASLSGATLQAEKTASFLEVGPGV